MNKKIIFIVLLIGVIVAVAYNYVYQDHRNIQQEQSKYIISANDIFEEFYSYQKKRTEHYLDATVSIKGKITEVNSTSIALNNKIFCQFDQIISTNLKIDQNVEVKGRCIGFDDLLEQVKLDQCTIIKY